MRAARSFARLLPYIPGHPASHRYLPAAGIASAASAGNTSGQFDSIPDRFSLRLLIETRHTVASESRLGRTITI
jgi:hypothetical protein